MVIEGESQDIVAATEYRSKGLMALVSKDFCQVIEKVVEEVLNLL